jgi:hypothetical protein
MINVHSFLSVNQHMANYSPGTCTVHLQKYLNKNNGHTTNQQTLHHQTVQGHPNHTQLPASLLLICQPHSLTWAEESTPGTWHRLAHHILLHHQRCKGPTDGLAMAFLGPEIVFSVLK